MKQSRNEKRKKGKRPLRYQMPETNEKLVGELNEIEFNALIERFIQPLIAA
jgi:hypothetical protein